MILSACLCLIVLNFGLTSAAVRSSTDKADELNYYIAVNYLALYENYFPVLEKQLEDATLQCEIKLNATVDTCLACIERNQNTGKAPGKPGIDKLILGLIPSPVAIGLDKFGGGIKDAFGKDLPNFVTKVIPKTFGGVGKDIGKFFTGTIPKTFGGVGKDIGKFFTGTIPGVTKDVGKHLDKFFTGTLPNVGKDIVGGFKDFGSAVGDLFGRKRRAASVCPACDKIDSEKLTNKQMRLGVCGQQIFDIFEEYVAVTAIFEWLKAKNPIITNVSFRDEDTISEPFKKVFTAKPFTVTYSIGAGAPSKTYTETAKTLDLYDYTNTEIGDALAKKIWEEYTS